VQPHRSQTFPIPSVHAALGHDPRPTKQEVAGSIPSPPITKALVTTPLSAVRIRRPFRDGALVSLLVSFRRRDFPERPWLDERLGASSPKLYGSHGAGDAGSAQPARVFTLAPAPGA
jgi:hypothetical protein